MLKDTDTEKDFKIEVEEYNLEDLIVLGEDKLVNIKIEYPKKDGSLVVAKAKIKQLTMKELRNINLENITLETCVKILEKSLFKEDETHFTKELILNLPVGVVNGISNEILRISGVNEKMGF